MQFLILGYDAPHPDALAHRMEIRPQHLEFIKSYKERGELLTGGAQLDSEGQMKGSMLVLEFSSEQELEYYLANEPYIVNKVWQTYEVIPFKMAKLE
jgi:uncharacterized protein